MPTARELAPGERSGGTVGLALCHGWVRGRHLARGACLRVEACVEPRPADTAIDTASRSMLRGRALSGKALVRSSAPSGGGWLVLSPRRRRPSRRRRTIAFDGERSRRAGRAGDRIARNAIARNGQFDDRIRLRSPRRPHHRYGDIPITRDQARTWPAGPSCAAAAAATLHTQPGGLAPCRAGAAIGDQ
jgi:hypothetical protein